MLVILNTNIISQVIFAIQYNTVYIAGNNYFTTWLLLQTSTCLLLVLLLAQVYGVQMNGYVEKDGQKFLWIAKRSQMKQTFPGMLDELVAGGLVCHVLP